MDNYFGLILNSLLILRSNTQIKSLKLIIILLEQAKRFMIVNAQLMF